MIRHEACFLMRERSGLGRTSVRSSRLGFEHRRASSDRPRSWHDAAYGEPLAHPLDLDGRKSSCESHDPDFVAKTAEIIGLYLDPP
jgi:hypothetical protein